MFTETTFHKAVYNLKDLPKQNFPEIVLCGRSNVGKSSFINSLFNKKNLAKTSSTPGKTRSINYYLINNKYFVVDLPGYGYAKVSKDEREFWGKILSEYFSSPRNFKYIIHLIDSRHKPTNLDIELHDFIRVSNLNYIALLNKSDKLKQSEKAQAKKMIKEFFPELKFNEDLFFYSAVDGTGRKDVIKLFSDIKD